MPFTKLDSGLLLSSIMREPPEVFKVFIAILAACDADGVARVSSAAMPGICYLTQPQVDRAIKILSSPDKHSRSLEEDGRRIRRVDGGYYVVNYHRYREASKTDYLRDKQRTYRKRSQERDECIDTETRGIDTVPIPSTSASSSASTSSGSGEGIGKGWRQSYDAYSSEHNQALAALVADEAWMADMVRLNPGVDIRLTAEKASRYWCSEAGWKKCKSRRSKDLDWKRCYENALSNRMNRVYIPKPEARRFGPHTPSMAELRDSILNAKLSP